MISIALAEGSTQSQLERGQMTLTLDRVFNGCNGIALWAEWHMDKVASRKNTISTGPISPIDEVSQNHAIPLKWNVNWRQGVHLFRKPLDATNKSISWTVKYNQQLKRYYFQFD